MFEDNPELLRAAAAYLETHAAFYLANATQFKEVIEETHGVRRLVDG